MHAHKWAKDNNNRHSWKKKRKGKEERKKAPLTSNDLPVLPIIGDLVTHAELQEACTSHDKDNNPGHILGPLPHKTANVVYGRPLTKISIMTYIFKLIQKTLLVYLQLKSHELLK